MVQTEYDHMQTRCTLSRHQPSTLSQSLAASTIAVVRVLSVDIGVLVPLGKFRTACEERAVSQPATEAQTTTSQTMRTERCPRGPTAARKVQRCFLSGEYVSKRSVKPSLE